MPLTACKDNFIRKTHFRGVQKQANLRNLQKQKWTCQRNGSRRCVNLTCYAGAGAGVNIINISPSSDGEGANLFICISRTLTLLRNGSLRPIPLSYLSNSGSCHRGIYTGHITHERGVQITTKYISFVAIAYMIMDIIMWARTTTPGTATRSR